MTTITISSPDARRLARAWDRAPELVAREMGIAITEAGLLVEREVRDRTPVGVGGGGGLRGSISAREPERMGNTIIGVVGTSLRHAVPVEIGRRPGGRMPPIAPLEDWAMQVLGTAPADARSVAWAIARKIAASGTDGARMFERGIAATRTHVERILDRGAERVVDELARAGTGR